MRVTRALPVSLLRFLVVFSVLGAGCQDSTMRRPPGYLRLGKLAEMQSPEQWLEAERLFLRLDERGYSVMSTLCTHDLTPLALENTEAGQMFVSRFTTSKYLKDGTVVSGPAKTDLPYYELVIAPEVWGGSVDTLYVRVGTEKPPTWRLPIPPSAVR